MAITGDHVLVYTPEGEALRTVLRDVLGWNHVDSSGGWLISGLPPAELGVHLAAGTSHKLSQICDDVEMTVAELRERGIEITGEPTDVGFGISVMMILPGGVEVRLYEPQRDMTPRR